MKNLKEIGLSCKVVSFGNPKYSNSDVIFLPPSSSIISRSNRQLSADLLIPLDIIKFSRFAKRLLKTEKFDIVHVEEPYVGAFVIHDKKVTTFHDTSYGDIKTLLRNEKNFASLKRIGFYFFLGFLLELICLFSSARVITPSRQIARELVKFYKTPPEKVRIIRSGVNLPVMVTPTDKKEAKKKLNLPTGKLLILTASQHIPRKRIDTLLKAILILQRRGVQGYQVVICGDGPIKPLLVNMSKAFGLSGIVKFTGWLPRNELELHYKAADIFVLTSEYEAGPIALLEAMSFGDAVVCSKIEGIPSLMCDGIDGLLFPVGDYVSLSKHLETLIRNATMLRELSISARRFAEKFDWRSVARDTVLVYNWLMHTE